MVTTQIELKASVWLRVLMVAMGMLALLSIALAHLPGQVQVMLVVGLLAAGGWGFWHVRKPLPGLKLKPDGQIQISVANADWNNAEVLPGSFVSSGLSVVRLRTADSPIFGLTLLPDSASRDELRRLRVSLRWASRIRLDTVSPDAD